MEDSIYVQELTLELMGLLTKWVSVFIVHPNDETGLIDGEHGNLIRMMGTW